MGLKFENYKFYHAVDNIIFGTNIENNTVTNVNQDISVKNIGIGLTLQKNNAKKRFFTPVLCISYVRVLPIFTNVYISENSDPILYTGFDKIKENNFNVATGLKGYYSIGRKSALFMNISIAYSLSKDLLFWLNMHKLTSSINVGYRLNIKP